MTSTDNTNEWYKVAERPPVMLDFATAEDIADNNHPGVNGLWAEVEISYCDNPEHMVLDAAVSINFDNQVKWEASDSGKYIGTPMHWRKK